MNRKYNYLKLICGLSALFSCEPREDKCQQELKYFNESDSPIISIREKIGLKNDSCLFKIDYNYWFSDLYISTDGYLLIDKKAFFIKLKTPETEYVKYFDFSKKVGDTYDVILFIDHQREYNVEVLVQNIVESDHEEYHIFRFFNSFEYDNHWTDTIIIASLSQGIIGSYFTYNYEGQDVMLEPYGNILKETIDYTNIEQRYLH